MEPGRRHRDLTLLASEVKRVRHRQRGAFVRRRRVGTSQETFVAEVNRMYTLLIILLVVLLVALILGGIGYSRRGGSQNTTIIEDRSPRR